jgi:5'-nucleotidase
MMNSFFRFIFAGLFVSTLEPLFPQFLYASTKFELTILHNNDIHSKYKNIPRLITLVHQMRQVHPNTLMLNAGDTFQGSLLYNFYKGKLASHFLNRLQPDAICLGNHEFDDGIEVLGEFLKRLKVPVVSSNILFDDNELQNFILPSVILERKGFKIGIIGVITPNTATCAGGGGDAKFLEVLPSVQNQIKILKDQGSQFIILLSHVGLEEDIEIARNVDGIDLIVGGHSHSLLSNCILDALHYPIVEKSPNGNKVLVITAYKDNEYLGRLSLSFEDGALHSWEGDLIPINDDIPEDFEFASDLESFSKKLPFEQHLIGESNLDLSNESCREVECNLGSLTADALYWYAQGLGAIDIALINGGTFRSGISTGGVRSQDLLEVFPFDDLVSIIQIEGSVLLRFLERTLVSRNPEGDLMHISGGVYEWDDAREEGGKILSFRLNEKEPFDPLKKYIVALPTFVKKKGLLAPYKDVRTYRDQVILRDIMKDHFVRLSPIVKLETDRIIKRG